MQHLDSYIKDFNRKVESLIDQNMVKNIYRDFLQKLFSPEFIVFYQRHPELSKWKLGECFPDEIKGAIPEYINNDHPVVIKVSRMSIASSPEVADLPSEQYLSRDEIPPGWGDSLIILFGVEKRAKAFVVIKHREDVKPYNREEVEFISNITQSSFAVCERIELTNQLISAEKNLTVNEVAAGIAHEIANNITPIIGRSQLLVNAIQDVGDRQMAERLLKHVQVIYRQGSKIARIASNLNRLSRPTELVIERISLEEEIASAVEIMAETAGKIKHFKMNAPESYFQLQTKYQPNLPQIRGDSQQLQQVFINLIINAAHTIEDKGRGILTVGTKKGPKNTVIGFVEDTGMGMTPEVQEQMWNPFYTTKKKGRGTGMGMAIVKNVVEAHGGRINIQSAVGKGTRFELIFKAL